MEIQDVEETGSVGFTFRVITPRFWPCEMTSHGWWSMDGPMIATLGTGGGDRCRSWKKCLLMMVIVLVAGLIPGCGLLPDPGFGSRPPPTREPIPATVPLAYAAEGFSLAEAKARAWKQQACLAHVLLLYDWTGTEWKATEFGYHFLDQQLPTLLYCLY